MPKSKRAKVVHLTKVDKKTKEHNQKLFANIQECLDKYQYCFVFSVANMRNTFLKQVRAEFTDSRIFLGKTKLMAHALSASTLPTPHPLAASLAGPSGLLFTSRPPAIILAHFAAYTPADYARAGTPAAVTFTLPAGTLYSLGGTIAAADDVPISHALEPELRRLNVPTRLEKGRVVLEDEYTVCREGEVLDSRQTRLLKLFGIQAAVFRLRVVAYWSAATQEVMEVDLEEQEKERDQELEAAMED